MNEIEMNEIVKQIFNGKKVSQKNYEELVHETSMILINKYNIIFDNNNLLPLDFNMADRVYLAALDLVETTGFFATGTKRIYKPKRDEILDNMENIGRSLTIGKGFDNICINFRKVLDERLPSIWGGPCAAPASEKYFIPIHQSYAKIRDIDNLTPASLITSEKSTLHTPLELNTAYKSIHMLNEALKLENRPNMCYNIPPSIGDIRASLSITNCKLTSQNTIHEIYNATDMTFNIDSITQTIHYEKFGIPYDSDQFVMLGGNTISSPEQMAIIIVAEAIKSRTINDTMMYFHAALDGKTGSSSTAESIWASSIAFLALTRNSKLLHGVDVTNFAGPCTEMMFYETAVQTISSTVCGADMLAGPVPNSLQMIDHAGGLDALFMSKMAELATTLSFDDANRICNNLYKKYNKHFTKQVLGKHFNECYDVEKIKPIPEYNEMYHKILDKVYNFAGQ